MITSKEILDMARGLEDKSLPWAYLIIQAENAAKMLRALDIHIKEIEATNIVMSDALDAPGNDGVD